MNKKVASRDIRIMGANRVSEDAKLLQAHHSGSLPLSSAPIVQTAPPDPHLQPKALASPPSQPAMLLFSAHSFAHLLCWSDCQMIRSTRVVQRRCSGRTEPAGSSQHLERVYSRRERKTSAWSRASIAGSRRPRSLRDISRNHFATATDDAPDAKRSEYLRQPKAVTQRGLRTISISSVST